MSENERRFETDVFSVNSLHLQPAADDKDENIRRASLLRSKEERIYSKEVILRLIEWLERI
jgi:hypothetical protein